MTCSSTFNSFLLTTHTSPTHISFSHTPSTTNKPQHKTSHLNPKLPQTPDKSARSTGWASHSVPQLRAAAKHGTETKRAVEVEAAMAGATVAEPINSETDQGVSHRQLRHHRKYSRRHLCCGRRQGRKDAGGTATKRRKREATGAASGTIANVPKSADNRIGALRRQTDDTSTCRTRRMPQVAVSNLEPSQVLRSC